METDLLQKITLFNETFKCKLKLNSNGCFWCNGRRLYYTNQPSDLERCCCYFNIYFGSEFCEKYINSYSFIYNLYDILNNKKCRGIYHLNSFFPILFEKNIYCPKPILNDKGFRSHLYAVDSLNHLFYRNRLIQFSIKKSVLYGIWCLKKSGLSKDMASLIGKYVWKSRGETRFWLKDKFYFFQT